MPPTPVLVLAAVGATAGTGPSCRSCGTRNDAASRSRQSCGTTLG